MKIRIMKFFAHFFLTVIIAFSSGIFSVAAQTESNEVLYIHDDCGFCTEVNAFIDENKLQNEVIIVNTDSDEKIESLRAVWNKYGVVAEDRAWPFLVVATGENELQYIAGADPIIEYLDLTYVTPPTNSQPIGVYLSLALVAVVVGAFAWRLWYKKAK